MAIKKSDIYRSLWDSCDQLRGGMDASLYKDYILTLLFLKYVSDRAGQTDALIEVPEGCSFRDIRKLRGTKDIGEGIDTAIAGIAEANDLKNIIDRDHRPASKPLLRHRHPGIDHRARQITGSGRAPGLHDRRLPRLHQGRPEEPPARA